MQLVERMLRFIPDDKGVHWDNICDEFEFRDSDELGECLAILIDYGFIERIEPLGITRYKRTASGRFTVTLANEAWQRAKDDNEIPF